MSSKPFGKKTRPAVTAGVHPLPASRGADTQYLRTENIIPFPSGQRFLPGSRDEIPETFILSFDVRELGALFVVAAVAFIPWVVIAGVVFLYLTLVA